MDLPGVDHLGYALNLTEITPFDIGAVEKYVLYDRRLLSIDSGNSRDVVIEGNTYSVPEAVSVDVAGRIIETEQSTFVNGKDAANLFTANASYPPRYFAVFGSTSGAHAALKSFRNDHQYTFFRHTENLYTASFRDYTQSLAEVPLIGALKGLPKPFISSDSDVVEKYKTFFRDRGSHVIISAIYGARYPLKVWASNKSQDVNRMFNADVNVKFNGIPSGGDFDASVKLQEQYKHFDEYVQWIVTVSGGGDCSKLATTEGTYNDYMEWVVSIKNNPPGLLSLQVVELWDLLKFSESYELQSYVDSLHDAFMWIIGHPNVYKTAVTMDIQSDWAEFDLLTPSAAIIPDPTHPYPPTNIIASETHVQWGKEDSHDYQHQVLSFFIINDGSPIDFSTSHGSMGAGSSKGTVTVRIAGRVYDNNFVTDNVWNTLRFYKVPVDRVLEHSHLEMSEKRSYLWSDILQEYLSNNA